jgi:hypothetical protein
VRARYDNERLQIIYTDPSTFELEHEGLRVMNFEPQEDEWWKYVALNSTSAWLCEIFSARRDLEVGLFWC